MTGQETNDRLAVLRRVMGDELAFNLLRVGREVADRWDGPTGGMNTMSRLVELGEAVKAAGLEDELRKACAEYQSRHQKTTDPYGDMLALSGGSAPLLEALDQQIEGLTQLRRELAQPAPRPRGAKIAT